jgi:uncharacterized OB-fold protein
MDKPVPIPDRFSAFYWEGAARGELLIQRCDSCERFQFPPSVVCEQCQSRELTPTKVSGRGSLYARTVLHQAFHPAFVGSTPYTVALVELDDAPGVRVLTNIVNADPGQLRAGDPLEVTFEARGDVALPQFRPAQEGAQE